MVTFFFSFIRRQIGDIYLIPPNQPLPPAQEKNKTTNTTPPPTQKKKKKKKKKKNRIWQFMQIVSIGGNLHEMPNPVLILSSAENF